jgi:hypothetical protein
MTAPPSPPANRHRLPSWLDLRLVLGVLLVLVSVVVGARVVATANSSVRVWAVQSDLAAGAVLTQGDLRSVRVRLYDNSERYLSTDRSPEGQTLTRDLGAGELLPRDALRPARCGSLLSIPVSAQHLPDGVAKGQRIDVFATAKSGGQTQHVLHGATVQAATRPKGGLVGSGAQWALSVRVPDDQVSAVVKAIRSSDIDVVVVGGKADNDSDPCGDLAGSSEDGPTPSPSPSKTDKPGGGSSTESPR